MAYQINRSDGTALVILEDGIVDSTTSLKLVGKNVVNYGTTQNENFLYLLENFANSSFSPPSNPISGQLWFNTDDSRLRLRDTAGQWNKIPSIAVQSTVTNQSVGDFWLDNTNNILYAKSDNGGYVRIGPNTVATTAARFANPVNINNVSFDGTADITISSTTTQYLSAGSYLTGVAFNGSQPLTWDVNVGVASQPTPFTVVARDSIGDIYFSTGHGTSLQAKFADLAEKYLISGEHEVGTVVTVGGPAEVRPCTNNDRAIGVVSGNPAYAMNSELEGGVYIALKGRVPTNVHGLIRKGDELVAGPNGRAISATAGRSIPNPKVFAIALEDSLGKDRIEALVL
jgi:hypothetical protein